MKRFTILTSAATILFLIVVIRQVYADPDFPKIIAHRGAGEHLPENTLPAFVLAAAMHADYLAMELVMTKDDYLVVFRDIELQHGTDVAEVFPHRARPDGRFYAIDFTLAELQQLQMVPDQETFPTGMRIPTFADTLALRQQLEKALARPIGLAVEVKKPWFHLDEGKDISSVVLAMASGIMDPEVPLFLQCHDPEELQRIRKTMIIPGSIAVKLVQLLDGSEENETQRRERDRWVPYNSDWLLSRFGTRLIALYADAVEIDRTQILTDRHTLSLTDLITNLQLENIKIHLRADGNLETDGPPDGNDADLFTLLPKLQNIEAIVTSSPGRVHDLLRTRPRESIDDDVFNRNQPSNTPTAEKDQHEHLYQ